MRLLRRVRSGVLAVLCILLGAAGGEGATTCPPGALATPKNTRLVLYFPTVDDPNFPEFGKFGVPTRPLRKFDIADLDPTVGATSQLRLRIFELVTDDYCEFDVKVDFFTTTPAPTEPRWTIVGLGTDGNTAPLLGEATITDPGDVDPQDHARIWADVFQTEYGGPGGALNGANSTLERWANAIAHTASHEAAHNWGADHQHSAPRPGSAEDEQNNHMMATGSTGLTGEMRASRNRHFSDQEYEILAHTLGLTVKTLYNWDFVNPNNTNADRLRLRLLTLSPTLTLAWFYTGGLSPWTNPTVTDTGTTQVFQGTTYKVFDLLFATGQAWSGGASGIAPPAVTFHVGASFVETGPVIVFEGRLFSGATALPLFPRQLGFSAGAADMAGNFTIRLFNMAPANGRLILRSLELVRVPRMVHIDSMVRKMGFFGHHGVPIDPQFRQVIVRNRRIDTSIVVNVGRFADKRTLDIVYGPQDCPPGSAGYKGAGDSPTGELRYCRRGNALSLFPATYTLLIANIVDPRAKFWNPQTQSFVTGAQEHMVFYQFGGFVPDFNKNRIDDLLDVRAGRSKDLNSNGVPDEAEARSRK